MKYLGIVLESFALYFYLIFLLRYLGKKEMSQLSISDLIVFLVISELMTVSIGNDEVSFLQSAMAALVVVVVDKLCSYLTLRSKRLLNLLEGHPSYLIYQGKVNQEKMKSLNYSIDDLSHHLREQGIGSLSQVEFAILETNGNLSVIEKDKSEILIPDSLISDGSINDDVLKEMNKDEQWIIDLLKEKGVDYKDVYYCILEKNDLYYILKDYK